MPQERSNEKIEKLLKAFAKRRREQMGAPLELDGTTRGMLQAEVLRRTRQPEEEDAKASLLTRLIFGIVMTASVVICAVIIFKGEPAPQVAPPLAQAKVSNGIVINELLDGQGTHPLPPASAPAIAPAQPVAEILLADNLRALITSNPPSYTAAPGLTVQQAGLGSFSLDALEKLTAPRKGLEVDATGVTVSFATPTLLTESGTNSNDSTLNDVLDSLNSSDFNAFQNATSESMVTLSPEETPSSLSTGALGVNSIPIAPSQPGADYTDGELAKIEAGDADTRETEYIKNKIDHTIIPNINLHDATVRDAIAYLKKKSAELDSAETDPARKGVDIVLRAGPPTAGASFGGGPVGGLATDAAASALPEGNGGEAGDVSKSPAAYAPAAPVAAAAPVTAATAALPAVRRSAASPPDARISLSLSNIPLSEALRYITDLSGLKYKTGPHGVTIVPLSEATEVLITKEYQVAPEVLRGAGGETQTARKLLENEGVEFPDGADAHYVAPDSKMVVRNTEENLELVDQIVDAASPPTEQDLKSAAADATTDARNAQSMENRLKLTIVPKIEFNQATLEEALGFLMKVTPGVDARGGNQAMTGGLNIVSKADPGTRITLSLTNVPLGDALRQIAGQAGATVKVDPYAVVIAPASETTNALATKEYTVPPGFEESFTAATSGNAVQGGILAGSGSATVSGAFGLANKQTAMDFLKSAGVEFPEGASANYFPATGKLVVRNTDANLGLVDKIVDASVNAQLEGDEIAVKKIAVAKTMQAVEGKLGGPEVVLASFQIQLEGDIVRIIDADGSVYTGKVEQPELQKLLATSNGRTFTNVSTEDGYKADEPSAANSDAAAQEQAQQPKDAAAPAGIAAAISNNATASGAGNGGGAGQQTNLPQQNFFFRATGFNRKLNKAVTFEGSYIAAGVRRERAGEEDQEKAKLDKDQEAQDKTEMSNNAAADNNARIQGQAQIGDDEKINVDAVVTPLKTKAAR